MNHQAINHFKPPPPPNSLTVMNISSDTMTIAEALENGLIIRESLPSPPQTTKDNQKIEENNKQSISNHPSNETKKKPQNNQSKQNRAIGAHQCSTENTTECCTTITCTAINIGISIPLFPLTNLNLYQYATLCCIKCGTGIVGLHISKQYNEQNNNSHPQDCFNSIGRPTLMLLSLPEIALNKFLGYCISMNLRCPENRSDLSLSKIFRYCMPIDFIYPNNRIACEN